MFWLCLTLYLVSCMPAYFVIMYIMYKSNHYLDKDSYVFAVVMAIVWPAMALIAGFVVGTMSLGEWTQSMFVRWEAARCPRVTPTDVPADELPD